GPVTRVLAPVTRVPVRSRTPAPSPTRAPSPVPGSRGRGCSGPADAAPDPVSGGAPGARRPGHHRRRPVPVGVGNATAHRGVAYYAGTRPPARAAPQEAQ